MNVLQNVRRFKLKNPVISRYDSNNNNKLSVSNFHNKYFYFATNIFNVRLIYFRVFFDTTLSDHQGRDWFSLV